MLFGKAHSDFFSIYGTDKLPSLECNPARLLSSTLIAQQYDMLRHKTFSW